MSERERVMESALERIANGQPVSYIDIVASGGALTRDDRRELAGVLAQRIARGALAEVRALPASNTETDFAQVVALVAKVDLHQRMRQGRGEETCEACLADLAKALRLARGEEASK